MSAPAEQVSRGPGKKILGLQSPRMVRVSRLRSLQTYSHLRVWVRTEVERVGGEGLADIRKFRGGGVMRAVVSLLLDFVDKTTLGHVK